jgi:Transposase DDE domain
MAHIQRASEVVKIASSSYTEARQKLSWEAFAYLLDRSLIESELWHGHKVRAFDGSYVQLPRSEEILERFPLRNNSFGEPHYPMLSLVIAADIFSGQPTHSIIDNKHLSEREALTSILPTFQTGDIAILDRGIDGKKIWRQFAQHSQYFLGRLRSTGRGVIKFKRHLKDQIIDLGDMTVRVLRGPRFKSGAYLYLITNLTDRKKYARREILTLYKKRQAVEDTFLHLKSTLGAKNIRSKKVNGVLQEIYAALTATSIAQGLRYIFERNVKKRRISFKAIVWRLESSFDSVVFPSEVTLKSAFKVICKFGHKVQPGRSYPRYSLQPENKWIKERRKHQTRRLSLPPTTAA